MAASLVPKGSKFSLIVGKDLSAVDLQCNSMTKLFGSAQCQIVNCSDNRKGFLRLPLADAFIGCRSLQTQPACSCVSIFSCITGEFPRPQGESLTFRESEGKEWGGG